MDFIQLTYQGAAARIDALKQQASRSSYYGLLVLAGLMGYYRIARYDICNLHWHRILLAACLIVIGAVSTAISFHHVTRSEELIRKYRRRLDEHERTYLTAGAYAKAKRHHAKHYDSWRCDSDFLLPYLLSLFLGYVLVFVYLVLAMIQEQGEHPSAIGQPLFLLTACFSITAFVAICAISIDRMVDP